MQLTAGLLQLFALLAAFADALQVVAAKLMNTLAVPADLADCIALLGSGIGDALGHAGNGADRRNDFIQRAIGGFGLGGGRFGVLDLGTHGLHRLQRGLLQAADQLLSLRCRAAVAPLVRCDSERTSSATTAKPRPSSPARAAVQAAA